MWMIVKPAHFTGLKSCLTLSLNRSSSLASLGHLKNTLSEKKLIFDFDAARPFEDIPGPKPLPVIGNTYRFLPLVGEYDMNAVNDVQWDIYREYGDLVRISKILGRDDFLFVFNANATEKILRYQGSWPVRPLFSVLEYYRHNTRKEYFGSTGGLFVEQREPWYRFRSKVQQPMMKPNSAMQYFTPMVEVSDQFMKRLRSFRDENMEIKSSVNFLKEMYKWGLESVSTIALDTRLGLLEPTLTKDSEPFKIIESMHDSLDAFIALERDSFLWKIMPTPTWNRLVRAQDFFNKISLKYIDIALERLRNRDPNSEEEPTFLERLLAREPDPKIATVMTLDMILAGIGTASHSVVFTLYNLAKNQDVQEKLYKDLVSVLPNIDDPLTPEKMANLTYLMPTIKESMRINPVFGFNVRSFDSDIVLEGYRIPANTNIFMGNALMSLLPQYFPEPTKFFPERWIRTSKEGIELQKSIPPFASLPFGHGPRMCIGRRFAELEMQIVLSKIIRRYRVEYPYEDIKIVNRLLNAPDKPMKFRFYDRSE